MAENPAEKSDAISNRWRCVRRVVEIRHQSQTSASRRAAGLVAFLATWLSLAVLVGSRHQNDGPVGLNALAQAAILATIGTIGWLAYSFISGRTDGLLFPLLAVLGMTIKPSGPISMTPVSLAFGLGRSLVAGAVVGAILRFWPWKAHA
jgi:hypothetical protein